MKKGIAALCALIAMILIAVTSVILLFCFLEQRPRTEFGTHRSRLGIHHRAERASFIEKTEKYRFGNNFA